METTIIIISVIAVLLGIFILIIGIIDRQISGTIITLMMLILLYVLVLASVLHNKSFSQCEESGSNSCSILTNYNGNKMHFLISKNALLCKNKQKKLGDYYGLQKF
jgi:hypothetical protein